jgi:hypothetical protein
MWIIQEGHIVDFADDFISADSSLLLFMIYRLIENNRWEECVFLMKIYNVDMKGIRVNEEFRYYWDPVHKNYDESSKIDWVPPSDDSESYLEYDGVLLLVENEHTFNLARQYLLSPEVDVIGIDVEMKPDIVPYEERHHAALLQISCRKCTFIFDLYKFRENQNEWGNFFRKILLSHNVIKLGYHFSSDLEMLNFGSSDASNCFSKVENVLDFQEIESLLPFLPDPSEIRYPLGLSRLSEYTLGKPLCKLERMSNWAQRPLRKSQLRYAALDSHVLILIWDYIISKVNRTELENYLKCFSA